MRASPWKQVYQLIPPGGASGQVLTKATNADFDFVWAAGGGGGAPTDALYVVLATNVTLTNERVLAVSAALTLADGGAGGNVTLGRAALTGDVTAAADSNATTIANDAVTYAKMQNVSATQRVLGRNTAGAGDTEEVTASQVLDWIGSTRGAIVYRGAAAWSILAPGTAGHVLTSNGPGADPSYQAAGAGSLPDLVLDKHVLTADYTITAGKAAYITRYLEIAAGVTLEIGADGDLEIG